jgi:alkanesulfonate monooxygenase SsuD/methylene tetrahydromethanopterin reductase-like flavin-dependent oxidoreductase (luciferase family)
VPISEPWTVLAAVATATTRIRLGTLVTPVARRRPWVLARQVTTVDHLSRGRGVLGVGLGVPSDAEYAAFGEPADSERHAALLDEGLEVLDALWSGDAVNHAGDFHRLDGVRFLPRPVQQPRVPIWSAASLPARAGIRRAARWDGVVPVYADGAELRPVTPDELAGVVAEIDRRRDRGDRFDVVVWGRRARDERRAEHEHAGATWLIDGPAPEADWLDDAIAIATEGPPAN